MKRIIIFLALVFALNSCCDRQEFDLIVYGGTSSGVMAAYSAAQMGLDVALVEPTSHIGGMTTGGLGYTDIGNKQAVTGLAKQFYRRIGEHYGTLEQWIFEPCVASGVYAEYLDHKRITLLKNYVLESVVKDGTDISSLTFSTAGGQLTLTAEWFIDCSYEGDLMAKSGVSYHVGREANEQYGETYDGVQLMKGHQFPDGVDPYRIPGNPDSGLLWGISSTGLAETGSADTLVQAYNYRICLTDSLENMIPITRPENYDSTRYELLLRLFDAQPQKRVLNNYFIWSRMPNRKTDINNRGGFSSDMIGMNHDYPEASFEQRKAIIKAHTDYTKGLLYFYGHDERVPEQLRREMLQWGYPKDEYVENGNWTPQLYVRECRRMVGEYVATQADCQAKAVPEDGIALAAYQMDSHNCQRIVVEKDGKKMVKNEGNVEIGGGLPYPISYRSLTPKREECTNLLVPVCMSASHIAYGSIRMEPVFMTLGQVAAIACALADEDGLEKVQDVDYQDIVSLMTADPFLDGSVPEVLVDDFNPGISLSGEWKQKKGRGGFGASYMEIKKPSAESRAEFVAEIAKGGEYELYSYQHAAERLGEELYFEIEDADGVHEALLKKSELKVIGQASGAWQYVGTYIFRKNSQAKVSVYGKEGEKPLHADALLFIKK